MIPALIYISQQYMFWQTIGWTVASGIFIGATLYNGDLSKFSKGLVTILPYSFMLFLTTGFRLSVKSFDVQTHPQALAGLATLLVVTMAYILGLFLGVITVHLTKGMKHK